MARHPQHRTIAIHRGFNAASGHGFFCGGVGRNENKFHGLVSITPVHFCMDQCVSSPFQRCLPTNAPSPHWRWWWRCLRLQPRENELDFDSNSSMYLPFSVGETLIAVPANLPGWRWSFLIDLVVLGGLCSVSAVVVSFVVGFVVFSYVVVPFIIAVKSSARRG